MLENVSIIMPVYNGEKYIKAAIDSVFSQTYQNFQLIIINDASTDNTEKIIQSFKDPRILYIKSYKNLGEFSAPIIGYSITKSKYVTMLDSDDLLPADSLEIRVRNIKNFEAIHGGITQLINDEKRYIKPLNTNSIQNIISFLKNHPNEIGINLPSFLYKTEVFNKIGHREMGEKFAHKDYEFILRLLLYCDTTFIDQNLYFYRIHDESVVNKQDPETLLKHQIKLENSYIKLFNKKHYST